VKRGGSLSFLVGTISNILVMEIGSTDVGSGGYILVSCAHSNTSFFQKVIFIILLKARYFLFKRYFVHTLCIYIYIRLKIKPNSVRIRS
jgi:hypothetical protein